MVSISNADRGSWIPVFSAHAGQERGGLTAQSPLPNTTIANRDQTETSMSQVDQVRAMPIWRAGVPPKGWGHYAHPSPRIARLS